MSSLEHEATFWGNCVNTWGEEIKQSVYADLMGIYEYGKWPRFDLGGKSVVDLGGGPVSMLLKTVNGGDLVVVDPCEYPIWTQARYAAHRIEYLRIHAETFDVEGGHFDEAWIYNVLQHVVEPEQVILVARHVAKVVRVFEWTDIPADHMHPHVLKAELLDEWAGTYGMRCWGVNAAWGETNAARSWSAVFF